MKYRNQLEKILYNRNEKIFIFPFFTDSISLSKKMRADVIKQTFKALNFNNVGALGCLIDEEKYSVFRMDDGIMIDHAQTARNGEFYSWEIIEEIIHQMVAESRFITQSEAEKFQTKAYDFISEYLALFYRDHKGFMPLIDQIFMERNGRIRSFDEEQEVILSALKKNPKELFLEYNMLSKKNSSITGLLKYLLIFFSEAETKEISYLEKVNRDNPIKYFLTDDFVYYALAVSGSSYSGGNKRIIDFYKKEHSKKEKIEFLKNEYGIGGRTFISRTFFDYDGKGVSIKYFHNISISYSWSKIASLYDDIFQSNCFGINFFKNYFSKKPEDYPFYEESKSGQLSFVFA